MMFPLPLYSTLLLTAFQVRPRIFPSICAVLRAPLRISLVIRTVVLSPSVRMLEATTLTSFSDTFRATESLCTFNVSFSCARVVNDIAVSRVTSTNLIIFPMSVKCLMFLLTYSSCTQKYVVERETIPPQRMNPLGSATSPSEDPLQVN